jgi:hypothetical protein
LLLCSSSIDHLANNLLRLHAAKMIAAMTDNTCMFIRVYALRRGTGGVET